MARNKREYRYVIEIGDDSRTRLKPYGKQTGTYFQVGQCLKDKKWYWLLTQKSSPWPAIARSGQGYLSRPAAERSIKTAFYVMKDVAQPKVQ